MSHARFVFASRACVALLGGLLLGFAALSAQAQPPYVEPMPFGDGLDTESARNNLERTKTQVLTGNVAYATARDDFQLWYRGYQFPLMTRWETQDLAKLRGNLYTELTQAGRRATDAHDALVSLCFEVSKNAVAENYHPAVRYNFMRIIGDLNQEEGESGDPPVPYAAAMPVMLDAVKDPEQIDAVRVAALIGINRHVQTLLVSQNPEQLRTSRARITSEMLALLDSLNNRTDYAGSPEGLAWMKRQAIEILGHLGQVGENGEVYAAIMAEMSDSSQPLFLRCAAAEALSRLSYPAGFDAAAQELYTQLGLLAFDCCNREITRVETWQAAYRPLDEFSTNGPAASTAGYSEQEYQAGAARQAVALRLKIKEQLTYIKNALEATVALGQESDEIDLHDGILSAVSDALTAVDQREEDGIFELDDLLEGVTDSANDLYDLLGIGDSPAPADTEEALGESGDEATGEDSGEVLPFDPTEAGGGPTAESGDAEPAEEEPPVEEEVIEEEVFDPTGLE